MPMISETNIIEYIKPIGDFKLKPCPFCASEEVVYVRYDTTLGDRFAVMCCNCMATIDPGWVIQKSIVMEMWNRRDMKESTINELREKLGLPKIEEA